MSKLTEEMVVARTKSSELGAVKKLNCWGSDLVDVSLVRKLHNVEVLSLSLNKITTLADFQYCRNLVELYIRRNAIHDLSELCYLQDLPRLRRLLLAENPCVETAGPLYRATVIRCLPSLEVLDNSEVSPEEVEQAMRVGLILEHPLARRERGSPDPTPYYVREDSPPTVIRGSTAPVPEYEEVFNKSNILSRSPPEYQSPYITQQGSEKERTSPPESPTNSERERLGVGSTNSSAVSTASANTTGLGLRHRSNSITMSPPGKEESGCNSRTNNNVNNVCNPAASSPPHDGLNASPSAPVQMRKVQRSPVQDYYTRERESCERGEIPTNGGGGSYQSRRGSTDYLQDTGRYQSQETYYDDSPPPQPRMRDSSRFQERQQNNRNSVVGLNNSKPRTKSSNLLSAVLCLIPELDWASLEVVEMAIRRRMDELVSD